MSLRLADWYSGPQPPHEPQPLPDQVVAPVYDHAPQMRDGRVDQWIQPPRWPDPLVFGDVAAQPEHNPRGIALQSCRGCGVRWEGIAPCWSCAPATGT